MKSSLVIRLALIAGLGLAGAPATSQEANTARISVNGMVCAFCAQGIEKRVSAMPEAGPLYINLSRKIVAVEARPGQSLDLDKLKREIQEAGYEVTAIDMVPQTVAALRAEYRAKK